MGIKGIYKEIGPGERISFCKLAVDTLERTGRPLRLAIDFSIWQFQVQAARGGSNPAIRTLFYRLVRLLSLAINPLFVFDGPNKPAFKRNKRSYSTGRGDMVATAMAKRLIRLFGFTTHDAPGEAEAECALLEQQGVVDAVLSEDVDTIMFGCRKTLRNWSAEGTKGVKTPTHVSVYDAKAVATGASGLDREGMVLVALMSGGDYLPEGVPGCGVKVAVEAARAGFGRELCRLKRADKDGLAAWKEKLLRELRTNESKFFRTRHKALEIPEEFPSMEILRYYTHPVVSKEGTVERLKREFPPKSRVDVVGLREFAGETFDWNFRNGAVKLIRVLAPSLLVQKLVERYVSGEGHDDLDLTQKEESALVRGISSKRSHFSTDATPELRISFVPAEIAKINLAAEPVEEVEAYGRSGIALNSDDEFDEEAEELGGEKPKSGSSKKPFDPLQPDLAWIPETVAKLGIPLTVEDWEGKQRLKGQKTAAKATRQPRTKKTDMPVGALDRYLKATKPAASRLIKDSISLPLDSSPPRTSNQRTAPEASGRSKPPKKTSSAVQLPTRPSTDINPWSLSSQVSPRAAKSSVSTSVARPTAKGYQEPILISSSPVAPASPPAARPPLIYGQTTPTRTKRLSSPLPPDTLSPAPLFDPFGSPVKQRLPSEKPASKELGAGKTQRERKARPFKRVKSGAEDTTGAKPTQKSITDFARVTKNASLQTTATKFGNPGTQPIETLSDDDDDIPLPPPKQPSTTARAIFGQNAAALRGGSLNFDSDDDPFGSPPPASRRTKSPSLPAFSRSASLLPVDDKTTHYNQPLNNDTKQTQEESVASTTSSHVVTYDRTSLRTVPPKPKPPSNTRSASAGPTITPTSSFSSSTSTTAAHAANKPNFPKKANNLNKSATTKLYIPRTSLSGLGYFTELEVPRDEAESVLVSYNVGDDSTVLGVGLGKNGDKGAKGGMGWKDGKGLARSRAFRLSDVEVLDLTGED